MTLKNTENLVTEIIERRNKFLSSKIKSHPATNFRASDIHECDRYMVHSVLDWDKRVLHDTGLQAIFDAGNKEEANVKNRLGYEIGLEFVEQQKPFEIKSKDGEVICRGHIDGKIYFNGEAIPTEIKSMNENVFNGIKSIDDFQKKPLHRKYLKQMQLYLFGNNEEAGLFILSNFRTEKIIPVVLDYAECEHILQKLERCWEFLKKKEYPERIDPCKGLCEKCPFAHVCLPEVKNQGAQFIDNAELEASLERRDALKPLVKEYDEIDEAVKKTFNGIAEAYIGKDWLVKGKEVVSNRINKELIPPEELPKYQEKSSSWRVTISKI